MKYLLLFLIFAVLFLTSAQGDNYFIKEKILYYKTNSTVIDIKLFRRALGDGTIAQIDRMVVDKGRYKFAGFHHNCQNRKMFMIDFQDSTLDFASNEPNSTWNDMRFQLCDQPGVSNAVMVARKDILPYTQGTIIKIDRPSVGSSDAKKGITNVTIQTHQGYVDIIHGYLSNPGGQYHIYQYVYDPKTLKPKFNAIMIGEAKSLNDKGLVLVYFPTDAFSKMNIEVGDYVVAAGKGTAPLQERLPLTGIYAQRCKNARFENLTSIGFSSNLFSEFGGLSILKDLRAFRVWKHNDHQLDWKKIP